MSQSLLKSGQFQQYRATEVSAKRVAKVAIPSQIRSIPTDEYPEYSTVISARSQSLLKSGQFQLFESGQTAGVPWVAIPSQIRSIPTKPTPFLIIPLAKGVAIPSQIRSIPTVVDLKIVYRRRIEGSQSLLKSGQFQH